MMSVLSASKWLCQNIEAILNVGYRRMVACEHELIRRNQRQMQYTLQDVQRHNRVDEEHRKAFKTRMDFSFLYDEHLGTEIFPYDHHDLAIYLNYLYPE